MDAPPIQYVRTNDGYNLAFFACGEGRPILFVPSRLNHLRRTWDRFGAWIQPLAGIGRLIHYDPRGQGLSTRGLRPNTSLADYVADVGRVLDHLKVDKAVLLAHGFGGHVATRFAATQPDRVLGLVLATVTVEVKAWSQPLWQGVATENWEFFLRSLAPSYLPAEELAAYVAGLKECESQADYVIATNASMPSRLDDVLPLIEAPALVLHPQNFVMVSSQEGPRLAAAMPNARLAMLGGKEDDFLGEPHEFATAIATFFNQLPWPGSQGLSSGLSQRELEVLRLLATGKSNQQIADELVISVNTANRHVSNIYAKTGAANRAEAVGYAHRQGLV